MFEDVKIVMFDLDGTIYYGSKMIPGARDAIEHCRKAGKRVFFLTNNSTKTRRQIFERLTGMGVPCAFDEVLTSGYVAALYAQRERLANVYVCGSDSLIEECESLGVTVSEPEAAENLLIGFDPSFDYAKLAEGVRVALRAHRIIACNMERTYPGEGAKLFPGCGGMVAPIEWCAGRHADFVVGKPNTLMLDMVCDWFNLAPNEMLMVGDTYESDILMANKKGCLSVLLSESQYPDTVSVSTIGELVNLIV